MRTTPRILLVLLVALFAATGVVNATGASVMDLSMALSDSGMAGCTGCETGTDDTASSACDTVCVSSGVATIAAVAVPGPVIVVRTARPDYRGPPGRTSHPDPYPPRTLILI